MPPSSLGMQIDSSPSACMSRKFSIGKVASRSCLAARGASLALPKRRALPISSAWKSVRRKASGAKIGASCSPSRSWTFIASTPLYDGRRRQLLAQEIQNRRIDIPRGASRFGMWPRARQADIFRAPEFCPPCAPSWAPARCGRARRRCTVPGPGCAQDWRARRSQPGIAPRRDRCAARPAPIDLDEQRAVWRIGLRRP